MYKDSALIGWIRSIFWDSKRTDLKWVNQKDVCPDLPCIDHIPKYSYISFQGQTNSSWSILNRLASVLGIIQTLRPPPMPKISASWNPRVQQSGVFPQMLHVTTWNVRPQRWRSTWASNTRDLLQHWKNNKQLILKKNFLLHEFNFDSQPSNLNFILAWHGNNFYKIYLFKCSTARSNIILSSVIDGASSLPNSVRRRV